MKQLRRLGVRLPNWVGDICFAQPALAELRRALPDTELIGAAPEPLRELLECFSELDDACTLAPGTLAPGLRRGAAALRASRLDGIVLLPNSFASALEAACAGIGRRIGFAGDGRALLLTDRPRRPRDAAGRRRHQVEEYAALVRGWLGIESTVAAPDPCLRAPAHQIESAKRLLAECGCSPNATLIIVCPGAAFGAAKKWPAQRFAEAADRLARRRGRTQIVIAGGPADRPSCAAVAAGLEGRALDLCGRTSLGTLAGLLAGADLVLANDSGALHLALALGTRAVGIYGPTDPSLSGPRGWNGAAMHTSLPCMPCLLRVCPLPRHLCMEQVEVERVVRAAQQLFEGHV